MSSFGSQMRKRIAELNKAGQDVRKILYDTTEGATIAAINKATEKTPPNNTAISGANTRSGELAQHWQTDSISKPIVTAGGYRTALANNVSYASYVNDGHRMDKHFVPGLEINGNMLEMNPSGEGGIMVGTKTPYVQGLYMKQAAAGAYRDAVRRELGSKVREALQ